MRVQPKPLALLIGLALSAPANLIAQQSPEDEKEPGSGSTYDLGYALGSFLVRPELEASLIYDDNIFATRSDEVDDVIALFAPALELESTWDRHKLEATTGANVARYRDHASENYEDYWADLEGRYDFSADTNVFGGMGYTADHEDRGSVDDNLVGDEPTTFDSRHAHAGVSHQFGDFGFRLGGTYESLDFDNIGALYNDDRDRDVSGIGARLSYEFHPDYEVYAQLVRDIRSYDDPVDENGFDRDSDGHRIAVGFKGTFTNRLQGGAYIGRIAQTYDDLRFDEVSALDFSGAVSFRATPRTTVTAAVDRTLEETTLAGASSYLYTEADVTVSHRIDSRTRLTAGLSAAEADYQDISRDDRLYSANASLRYYLTRRTYLVAGYQMLTRDSSLRQEINNPANVQDIADYQRQQIFLTLGTLLYPIEGLPKGFPVSQDRLHPVGTGWDGFYAGARIGHGSTHVRTDGVRGGSGIDQGEYGEEGSLAGAFIGYGLNWDRWYLGLELEGESANNDLYHRKDKADSRTLELDVGDGLGLTLRGGYQLASGPLLYARVGKARTEFKTYYTLNDATQNAVNDIFEQTGNRVGIGSDIPAGEHLFVRMEYVHTRYDDYTVDLVTEQEEFSPTSSFFNLGLGWQFGANRKPEAAPEAVKTKGFYAGAHLGHGALNTHLAGTHTDSGGVGGTSDFIGDFGSISGFTGGLFAGFGHNWDRWYLGLEAEAESSTSDWAHIRYPNGRNFDVEKKSTYGLSLRGGYQLDNGTLLYAKAGRVRTRFNTGWIKGGNRDNDIDRDDTVSGNRFAVGADIPATRSLFVRVDYAYTDYDSYGFETSHANSDVMTFDNSESLFRIGLGARF